ncbi:amidohydrolase family protein [Paracoccus sp. CPCC 101403]|uniref:Amidohydrolase family protein n=1 Tax=Paracoccus broussonetiae TaxID=3075834 RepID=A0ABU3EK06_9RHOB|nr:amidohydrolase family protein [Paracoccus sp. CPCC 101403]MDT1064588.1 amidohydrolase family protein [Paracoccus sp. CPCC 101403]
MTTIIRNVRLLDLDRQEGMTSTCDISITGGRIAGIGECLAIPEGAKLIEGNGNLLMPGLVNGHFHSAVNHMKGRLPSLPLEVFMLYECPELDVLRPTPREAYLRTMLGCIEMLRCGTTSVQDDCFFVPRPEPEIIDAVAQAYVDSGMRARLALDQPEVSELEKLPYLRELLPDDLRRELGRPSPTSRDDLLGLYDHLLSRWHGAAGGRIKAAASCSAPQRVSPEYFAALDQLSRDHDLPFYAHMLETKLQRVFGRECLNGRSLVRHTADLGLLTERMNVIHAIWVDDADLDLLAESGASVAHNPVSNLRLGSGVMRWRAMQDRGIPICLGVDEAIADDAVNMWSVMKTAALIHCITETDYERWPNPREILRAATTGGGHAMREPMLGQISVGAPADLNLIDLGTIAYVPLNDLPRQLVHCESGTSVLLTMVAGEVVRDGNGLTRIDEGTLLAEAREIFERKIGHMNEADRTVARYLPYYRKMYDLACEQDVEMERRVPHALVEGNRAPTPWPVGRSAGRPYQ